MVESSFFKRIAPGILVAATGVGAGDLINASLAGSRLGLVVLWAAWVGALLKWVLNEGIARWQLATGTTLLEGWREHLGSPVGWTFFVYLLLWTVTVSGAIVKACGMAGAALFGGSDLVWAIVHTLLGVLLVWVGRFTVFEKIMSVFIGLMFFTVTFSALKVGVSMDANFWGGLFLPGIPEGGLGWTLGVMGGVGGTVTLLSYGYWIQEEGREGESGLRACWLDLSVGYTMTALFGLSMIVIGSKLSLSKGASVALSISELLGAQISPSVGWLFLLGFWAAVFSSLLGVWQGVPYLFADFWRLRQGRELPEEGLTQSRPYRTYLLFIGLIPLAVQFLPLAKIAWLYAVLGSLFMPFLAGTLLYLNNRVLKDNEMSNPWWVNMGLWITLLFFAYQGLSEIGKTFA